MEWLHLIIILYTPHDGRSRERDLLATGKAVDANFEIKYRGFLADVRKKNVILQQQTILLNKMNTLRTAIILVCCLLMVLTAGAAPSATSADIERLSQEAYKYYSTRETAKYLPAIRRLRQATLAAGDEEGYYKAWSYEVLYTFSFIDRKQGVEMAQEVYRYAHKKGSSHGLYNSYYLLGTIRSMSGNLEMAEKSFHQAIELNKAHFPDESAAPCYLGLCEIALKQHNYEQVQKYARQALDEPNVLPMNQLTAWTYKCLVRFHKRDSLGFEQAYRERQQLMQKYGGQGGFFGELINVYRAKNRKQWAEALRLTDKIRYAQVRYEQRSAIYEHMGNYSKSLYWHKKYSEAHDSVQSSEARSQLNEFDSELAITQAENDAKDLRLSNQQLRLRLFYGVGAAVLLMGGILLYRRQQHIRRLEMVNAQLRDTNKQLAETTAAKERIESELRIARNIQMGMVPNEFPQRDDLDLYAMMTPAREVGGDLYSYILQDDHRLYFCVGDVSGKGVPASLFMAQVTRMFIALADGRLMPDNIATRLNHALTEGNDQGMFVTMFIGLIDLHNGHLDFCNAGHNPPLLDGQFIDMEPNAPIGLWPDLEYIGEEIPDLRGKTLFIYTDGINEAENKEKEQFGDDRLRQLLAESHGTAQQTSEYVHEAVEQFVGEAEPSDDLTKMCIKL